MKTIVNRISTLATAGALILAQVIMPTHAAFADEHPGGKPAGNNGTIKISGLDTEDTANPHANDPHVSGCTLNVSFFGYDEGARTATVSFEAQAPTAGQLVSPLGEQPVAFTGKGQGGVLDYTEPYTLAFTGAPQQNQGYHVKVTVHADYSQGSDTKYKTVWVEGCIQTPETIETPTLDLKAICGVANDIIMPSESEDYTASAPVWIGTQASVTFTIREGVNKVFENGLKTIQVPADELNTDDCEEPAQPTEPVFTQAVPCKEQATIYADYDTEKYIYMIALDDSDMDAAVLESGVTQPLPTGTYTVRIYALDGELQIPVGEPLTYTAHPANGCGGGPTDEPGNPATPAAPEAPAVTTVAAGMGSLLPVELPHTGPSDNFGLQQLLLVLTAAGVTYGAAYFAQPKRRYE